MIEIEQIIKNSNGKLFKPSPQTIAELISQDKEKTLQSPSLILKNAQLSPMVTRLNTYPDMPSPSDFGLTQHQVDSMKEKHQGKFSFSVGEVYKHACLPKKLQPSYQ